MPFIKGQIKHPNSGRKSGTRNKKTILNVVEVLNNRNINPTEEILKLLPALDPHTQMKAWMSLLSYTQGKPTDIAEEISNETTDAYEGLSRAELVSIVESVSTDKILAAIRR